MEIEMYGLGGTIFTCEYSQSNEKDAVIDAFGAGRKWVLKKMSSGSPGQERKLKNMMQAKNRRKGCVWPADIVYHNGRMQGVIYDFTGDMTELPQLYGSKLRSMGSEGWEEDCIGLVGRVMIARNLAELAAGLHRDGDIIGNFSEKNILVNPDNYMVRLNNCETFRLMEKETKNYFPAELSDDGFLPGGLRGKSNLEEYLTEQLDDYLLAKYIYRIITGMDYDPTRDTQALFSDDFRKKLDYVLRGEYSPAAAYTKADEWARELGRLTTEIRTCEVRQQHEYCSALSECPWCGVSQARQEEPVIPEAPAWQETEERQAPEEHYHEEPESPDPPDSGGFFGSGAGLAVGSAGIALVFGLLFYFVIFKMIGQSLFTHVYMNFGEEAFVNAVKFNMNGLVPLLGGLVFLFLYLIRKRKRITILSYVGAAVMMIGGTIIVMFLTTVLGTVLKILIGGIVVAGILYCLVKSKRG